MNKQIINSINVTLDAYSIVISLIIVLAILFLTNKKDTSPKLFAITNISAIFYGISDIFMWISEGVDAPWKRIALPLSSFLFYFFGILIFLFYIMYIINYYNTFAKVNLKYTYFCYFIVGIYLVFLFLTPFFNCFYEITSDNVYVRGQLFIVTVISEALLYIETLWLVLKYHKKLPFHQNIAFSSFIFIPFLFQIIQILNFGIALISVGITLSFFIIFISLNKQIKQNLEQKESLLNENEGKLIGLQQEIIISLSSLVENRDSDTGEHIKRTSSYVKLIIDTCLNDEIYVDQLTPNYITSIERASPLHDIGKIVVPDNVLKKPGKLTAEEFEQMQRHAKEGGRIVREVIGIGHDKEFLRVASEITSGHHEKWNGKGYPYHLEKDSIPLSARIMAIADVFDALVTPRCYKEPMSYNEAFEIIQRDAGEHFDPILAKEFLKVKDKVIQINEKYKKKWETE